MATGSSTCWSERRPAFLTVGADAEKNEFQKRRKCLLVTGSRQRATPEVKFSHYTAFIASLSPTTFPPHHAETVIVLQAPDAVACWARISSRRRRSICAPWCWRHRQSRNSFIYSRNSRVSKRSKVTNWWAAGRFKKNLNYEREADADRRIPEVETPSWKIKGEQCPRRVPHWYSTVPDC